MPAAPATVDGAAGAVATDGAAAGRAGVVTIALAATVVGADETADFALARACGPALQTIPANAAMAPSSRSSTAGRGRVARVIGEPPHVEVGLGGRSRSAGGAVGPGET